MWKVRRERFFLSSCTYGKRECSSPCLASNEPGNGSEHAGPPPCPGWGVIWFTGRQILLYMMRRYSFQFMTISKSLNYPISFPTHMFLTVILKDCWRVKINHIFCSYSLLPTCLSLACQVLLLSLTHLMWPLMSQRNSDPWQLLYPSLIHTHGRCHHHQSGKSLTSETDKTTNQHRQTGKKQTAGRVLPRKGRLWSLVFWILCNDRPALCRLKSHPAWAQRPLTSFVVNTPLSE